MNRRDVLRVCATGIAASVAVSTTASAAQDSAAAAPAEQKPSEKKPNLAGSCGLYCGGCSEMKSGKCHGCGCGCGKCTAAEHAKACKSAHCTAKKGLSNCGDCKNFACSDMVMHAHDTVWRNRAVCLENLRRRKTVGTDAWLAEQQRYWADEDNLRKRALAERDALAMVATLKKDFGYTRPY
jgi:hypothetical protein